MLRASAFTAVGLCFLALPILSRAANGPIRIPGPAEGKGVFSMSLDYTDRPANGGGRLGAFSGGDPTQGKYAKASERRGQDEDR